jgi:transglutaminase-like putative cysteine protease
MRRPPSLAVMIAVLVIALPAAAAEPDWSPVTAAELAEDKPQLEAQAPAEILDYHLQIDDTRANVRQETSWIRYKIFDPARAADITRIARFWNGNANRDYQIRARLTLPNGTSRTFDEHDMSDRNVAEEGRGNGLFGFMGRSDSNKTEEKFLAVTGVVKGAILDVWQIEPNTAKTDWLMNSVQRDDAPIRKFEYESRYTPNLRIQLHAFVLNPCGGKMTQDDRAGIMRFTAANLPSIRHEPYGPPDTYFSLTIIQTYEYLDRGLNSRNVRVRVPESVPLSLGPWAFFSTAQDYQDADKGYPDTHVREKAAELAGGTDDPREKASRIFYYVENLYQRFRNRADLENAYTRYISSLDELIDLDRIDSTILRPEDFHFLFVGLIRSAGLECHSVYHPQRTSFPFSLGMVSPNFLNEWSVAVKIGAGWVLCDPTSDVPLAFGELPWQIEGEPALMALPRRQAFLNVPSLPAGGSVAELKMDAVLDSGGDLSGMCVCTLTGHAAHVVRERLQTMGQEDWAAAAQSLFSLSGQPCEVRLLGVEGYAAPDQPLVLRAKMRWPAYAAAAGDRMTFVLSVFTNGRAPVLAESTRTTPVFFHFPSTDTQSITVHLPDGFRTGPLPKPITGSGSGCEYSLAVARDPANGILLIDRTLKNTLIGIPVADYPRARDWYRRVSLADQIGIVLTHE